MSEKSTQNDIFSIFLLYLFPILGWIFYSYINTPLKFSWPIALAGVILLFFGSTGFFLLLKMRRQEAPLTKIVEVFSPPIVEEKIVFQSSLEHAETISSLQKELEEREFCLANKEEELSTALMENQECKNKLSEVLESLAFKEEEARRKIESLEHEVHQKAQTSQLLENQIHDLRYEIKTLLQLTEVDYQQMEREETPLEPIPLHQIPTAICQESSKGLLTRCINIAQKMTAGYHASSIRHLSSDPYAFDLRRLSDALRQEMGALIVVYSPKEERVLFSNAESKNLLGLNPEQFAQDFAEYIGAGFSQWKSGVMQLLTKSDVSLSIDFHTKAHDTIPLKVMLGSIPTGVFRSLVIGVLQVA